MGIWWRENRNTLVKWKALVNSVGIKGADLEDKFLQCASFSINVAILFLASKRATTVPNNSFIKALSMWVFFRFILFVLYILHKLFILRNLSLIYVFSFNLSVSFFRLNKSYCWEDNAFVVTFANFHVDSCTHNCFSSFTYVLNETVRLWKVLFMQATAVGQGLYIWTKAKAPALQAVSWAQLAIKYFVETVL